MSEDTNGVEGPGRGFVPPAGIVVVTAFLFLLAFLAAYTLIQFWPSAVAQGQPDLPSTWFWWHGVMPDETQLFLVVLAAGGLGGLAHSVRSLYWYVGNRKLHASWTLMYVTLPLTGSGMALLIYLVLRGGLTTSFSTTDNVNPYGIAAISALAGLFSREAVEKLKAVFEVLLAPAEKGKDSLSSATVDRISPLEGRVGDPITITGTGLAMITQVRFGSGAVAGVGSASDLEITLVVPSDAKSGRISLTGPAGTLVSRDTFTVLPTIAPAADQVPVEGRPTGTQEDGLGAE